MKTMEAEIIAVGSELLTPDRMDTNSLYITEKLNEAGFAVRLKSIVGDNAEDLADLLRAALQRSRLIVLCGGLGPTEDDLTRSAAAAALRRRIRIDQGILESLRRRFALRGYRMPQINERQAEVIEGAEILDNPVGTAPGMWLSEGEVRLALLPGPPRELRAIFESQVFPRAAALQGGRHLEKRTFSLQGLPESEVDSKIAPIYKDFPQIQTTILAATGIISIRLQQWLLPHEKADGLLELSARICSELGDVIFTAENETLEEVVGKMLRRSGRSIAVAESCTAGSIGSAITRIPGSSDYFRGGVLCYSNDLKSELCGVPRALLEKHGAVSPEVAQALASGVRRLGHSSVGLAVTGIAGPGGGSEQKPVGLVYFGLAEEGRCIHKRRIFGGDRDTVRDLATTFALGYLRRFLMTPEVGA